MRKNGGRGKFSQKPWSSEGLANSTGEFITFVDADDLIAADFLQTLYDGIVANNNDISVCGVEKVRDGNAEAFNSADECHQIEIFEIGTKMALLNRSFVYAKLYKKSIIDQSNLRFDETMSIGEDTLFAMQYLTNIKNGAYVSNKRLYQYICGDVSSLSNKYHNDIDKVYEKIYDTTYLLTKVHKGFCVGYSKERLVKERLVATMAIQNLYSAGCKLNAYERRRVIRNLMKNEQYRNSILNEMKFKVSPDGLRKLAFFFKCPMMIDIPFSIIASLKQKGKVR